MLGNIGLLESHENYCRLGLAMKRLHVISYRQLLLRLRAAQCFGDRFTRGDLNKLR